MMNNQYTNVAAECQILQLVAANPTLLNDDDQYFLTSNDFTSKDFKTIYNAMNYLAKTGNEIDRESVALCLQDKSYDVNVLATIFENSVFIDELWRTQYEQIKAAALLRDLKAAGIQTPEIKIDAFNDITEYPTADQIMESIRVRFNDIEEKHFNTRQYKGEDASKGLRELIAELKISPEIGETLDGEIFNYIVRGARYGKFYLNSSPQSHGKTRKMVGQACALSLPYINDDGLIITKDEYFPVLYVATEQESDEIKTLIVAYVSGVNEEIILTGKGTAEDDRRIELAIQIIEQCKERFFIEIMPNPTIGLIRTKFLQYIYKRNVHFVFYDYIFTSPGLLSEFRDLRIREDVALMMLSNSLKEMAAQYQIFIMSATQVSGEYENATVRNVKFIRGAKSITDKIDVGIISMKLSDEERLKIETVIDVGEYRFEPNMVTDVYKNRRGKVSDVKIFSYFDYGTCRIYDLFMTDIRYNLLHKPPVYSQPFRVIDNLDLLTRPDVYRKEIKDNE